MAAYDNYFAGQRSSTSRSTSEDIDRALRAIEGLPTPA